MVVMIAILGAAGLALRLTSWYQDIWTNSTGNLPRKRRTIVESGVKHQTIKESFPNYKTDICQRPFLLIEVRLLFVRLQINEFPF